MLSKQLTSKLKEEQERENQHNPAISNVAQCDRLIRTVSCKHDPNHAVRKANINVLQSYDEIKLYVSPINVISTSQKDKESSNFSSSNNNTLENQNESAENTSNTNSTSLQTTSAKLPRRNQSFKANPTQTESSSEVSETNLKEILDKIVNSLTTSNVAQWFALKIPVGTIQSDNESTENSTQIFDLFESIENALNHIDYNLKRNSDFINELTKLLDTSRAIKQEAQLKKILKSLEDEKNAASNVNNSSGTSISQPPSPLMRSNNLKDKDNQSLKEEDKKKAKSKSFKGLSFTKSKSKETSSQSNIPSLQTPDSTPKTNFLTLPGSPQQTPQLGNKQLSAASSMSNLETSFQKQLKLNQNQSHEINNSDYIELESEVEKISYYLDNLFRQWSKLAKEQNQDLSDPLKFSIEFQTLISNLNSSVIVKELEQSLFKLNWLVTSKSGFSEPNWKTNVLSITPSTCDSFIGVNLLKNYYKYVKYDFVSYKLFTRQLQLIQICAVILNLIHRILVYYRESTTLSSITNTLNGLNTGSNQNSNFFNDTLNPSLLSLTFSADRYRPISWSANHVTLYNVQGNRANQQQIDNERKSVNLSRTSSTRRANDAIQRTSNTKEDHIRQIKNDLFIKDLKDFVSLSAERLNLQADLANRTGYFYIVNQSTGLVLQAVDFTSEATLKEQIEQNQKKLQNSSVKGRLNNPTTKSTSVISKGPRFYLMPKINSLTKHNTQNANLPSSLSNETASDEQLWYYYLINGCVANKIIRSGHCMAASSLNAKSPVTFWPNVKTTNCSWFFNHQDQTIVSGLSEDLVLDYVLVDEPPNQRYAVIIDNKVPNKASQKWSFEFC